MDPLPPNDPNNNGSHGQERAKVAPVDGRQRRGQELNEDGEMDVLGDLQDHGFVIVMFMMGLASFLLRDYCTC